MLHLNSLEITPTGVNASDFQEIKLTNSFKEIKLTHNRVKVAKYRHQTVVTSSQAKLNKNNRLLNAS